MADRPEIPVTIIIPAYLKNNQDVKWLEEAVTSAATQTVKVKVIIIENGSNILEDVNGESVFIFHSDKGLSKARNFGIRKCETEFFFPLDANDWLPTSAIETVYSKRAEKGFTYGSTVLFRGERGEGDQHLYTSKPYDFQEVMKMVYFPNGALQRKADWEAVGGYRESLPFLEDWDYWMTCGEKGICGTAIYETIYWYRQHDDGLVSGNRNSQKWEEVKKIIQSLHRDIYKGVYPPMCCGNKNKATTSYTAPAAASLTPGADGMLLIEYIGGNTGKMPWYGAFTKIRYTVSGIQRQFYIDARDALTGSKANPGFLEIVDHGNPLFKKVE